MVILRQLLLCAVGSAFACLVMSCSKAPPVDSEGESIRPLLPGGAGGWTAVGDEQVYDTESIYSYIDGHAEVYMAYGMIRCLSQRYSGPEGEPDIVLDLYEQASAADAFGVFTHDRDGEEVDVGQGALFRHGWLSFWKGHWFGSVYAEGESEASAAAVMAIGRATAGEIAEAGEIPPIVADLPADGLDPRSVRFLHTQEILNGVIYLGYDNVLRFGADVDAAVGRYENSEGSGWMLLIDYPTLEAAEVAGDSATESGIAVRRRGTRLAAVLAAEPQLMADGLLDTAMGDER